MKIFRLFKNIIFSTLLILISGSSFALDSQKCEKFYNKSSYGKHYHENNYDHLLCVIKAFSKDAKQSKYASILDWLKNSKDKYYHSENASYYFNNLFCDYSHKIDSDKKELIDLIDHIIKLKGSITSSTLLSGSTALHCVVNRKESDLLDYILTKEVVSQKDLDVDHNEGGGHHQVPIYKAIYNNDLETVKVLVKHGASTDFSFDKNETTLKIALKEHNIKIANWLLDIGVSVHKRDEQNGCTGKSALDYSKEIPKSIEGRDELVSRIKSLMYRPYELKELCRKSKWRNKLLHQKKDSLTLVFFR